LTKPQEPTAYRLTASFPFLLARAGVRMGELFSAELRDIGMTLPMYRALAALWERDGQRLSELSAMIGIELSTLSRLVTQLKQRGWVSRHRPAGDERSVRLSLTARGRERVASLIPRARHFEALATGGFTTEDVVRLKDALRLILANLGEAPEVASAEKPERARAQSRAENGVVPR
jgi:DNA-binding MarR family transcriptional regulator